MVEFWCSRASGVIEDDSIKYERAKHDGTLPIIGVNTFLPRRGHGFGSAK